ncbi:L-arabinose isomerase [Alicyclobacillaceae bacterium I2511]|nr:L-arabinose isomerase [Alicyclobacillaceae bacterium I2511]
MKSYRFWFICGSQHLYGPQVLAQVKEHARAIVTHLNESEQIPFPIDLKPIATTAEEIRQLLVAANVDGDCAGVVTWMHTFSPAKMWISGLTTLNKPLLHLHTQFHRDIPWETLDMDFMNLNQSAHGDREYGFLATRMNIARKVIAGHWSNPSLQRRLGLWMRTAVGVVESQQVKVARFGDNMREVAVTEGDKVEAQIRLGWSVSGYGMGDLVQTVQEISEDDVTAVLDEYATRYEIPDGVWRDTSSFESVRGQARIELGMRRFLDSGGFNAFTTTFEDLHGLDQLPGLAVQRLMESGFGFGAEGDWKTAALLRVMKVMAGFKGTSFMEDYTYHLEPGNERILGAHMLEVCPTIAATRPRIEVHPLSIGAKADPARMVFNGRPGPAVCAALVDLGSRFRLVVNEVEAVEPQHEMPQLPVARVLWRPQPTLQEAAEAWIYAGGAHHTVFSYNVTTEQLQDWAEMVGVECVVIDKDTSIRQLRNELRWGNAAWR